MIPHLLLCAVTLDYSKPVHLVRTPGPTVEVTEEFRMVAPNIRMAVWGVGFGTTPSDGGQELISSRIWAEGASHRTRQVTDKLGQRFWLLEASGVGNEQSLTCRATTKIQLFRRELKQGADPNPPTLAEAERRMWLRLADASDASPIRAWMSQMRLYRDPSQNQLVFAQKVLTAMEASLAYKWDSSAPKGIKACLSRGWGACGDLNDVAVSVLKVAGIPARLRQGRNIVGAKREFGPDDDGTFHVAAEFWADNVGWVPIEASAFSGPSLTTGGQLRTYLGRAEPSHLTKHYDFAWLDGQKRSFQTCDWPFGRWQGSWDGWKASGQFGFTTAAPAPESAEGDPQL